MAKMIETTENIQIPGDQIVSDSGITWLDTKSGDNVQSDRDYIYPHNLDRSTYVRQVHEQPPIVKDTSCPNRNDTVEYMKEVMYGLDKDRILADILENIQDGQG